MSTETTTSERDELKSALREELRQASEQSKQKPPWAKRRMPAIRAAVAGVDER